MASSKSAMAINIQTMEPGMCLLHYGKRPVVNQHLVNDSFKMIPLKGVPLLFRERVQSFCMKTGKG